ncbi:hypothetical protein WJ968_18410 [Achromobacter xylosoxidans]
MHAVLDAEHEDLAQRLAVRAAVAIVAVVTGVRIAPGVGWAARDRRQPRIQELPGRLRARAGLQEQLILRGRQAVGQRGLAGPVNADAVALGAAVGRGVLFIDVEGDAPPFQGLRQAQAAQAGAGDGDVEGEGVMGGFQWMSMETA